MSCTSRAIRSRSSTTARSTSRSRSSAIRCANSCASRVRSRSLRIASPISAAVTPIATPPRIRTGTGLSSPVMPTAAAITVPAYAASGTVTRRALSSAARLQSIRATSTGGITR